ncbi:hypothetical protein VTN00DRAFT_6494 [Thermoascus crustaceus]|uniref:uncharacterized protein n=1 Tax=Thermoascus crustaceus TaxID=5088 RepID=UPI0037433F1C
MNTNQRRYMLAHSDCLMKQTNQIIAHKTPSNSLSGFCNNYYHEVFEVVESDGMDVDLGLHEYIAARIVV